MKIMLSANIFKTVKHVKVKTKTTSEWAIPEYYNDLELQRVENLKAKRYELLLKAKRYKVKQVDAAKAAGISQATVSGYVNNNLNPCSPAFYEATMAYEKLVARAEKLLTDKEG